MPPPPREPEIEFMGKVAHGVLALIRVVFFGAGVCAIVYGVQKMGEPPENPPPALGSTGLPSAAGTVWLTLGLPLIVRCNWIFTKGATRWVLLAISALLWFAPMGLDDDSAYGYILRMFATLVSFLTLLVWRTLWRLTEPDVTPS